MLYVENGFGGEEEMIRISLEAILIRVGETLRRAQVDINGRNDSVDTIVNHIGERKGQS